MPGGIVQVVMVSAEVTLPLHNISFALILNAKGFQGKDERADKT